MAQDDKRKAGQDRQPISLVVEYDGAEDLCRDFTENLSSGGTFVHTDRALAVDEQVSLQLSFPRLLAPLRIYGVVRWVRTIGDDEGVIGVGIEFIDFAGSAQQELEQIVEHIKQSDPEYVQQGIKVLLVEDNPHVAALIRDGLRSGRYSEADVECIGASDGREALRLLHSQNFDVLVIDVNLPVVDGPAVITALRKDEAHRGMPVIAVSAGGEVARQEAMDAGADFFLDKPMRLREIFATMHLLLDGQTAQ
jgi:uncharacterized protein (TIGR02266 family)